MCTFTNDRELSVCDVAIGQVKAKLTPELGDALRYTHLEGEGTLIEAAHTVDAERLRQLVDAGIAEADHKRP